MEWMKQGIYKEEGTKGLLNAERINTMNNVGPVLFSENEDLFQRKKKKKNFIFRIEKYYPSFFLNSKSN